MFSFFSPTLLLFQLGMYKNEDIEKLIPLSSLESQQDMPEEVSAIFRDTLCVDPTSRPTALQLMAYSALKDGEPLTTTKPEYTTFAQLFWSVCKV